MIKATEKNREEILEYLSDERLVNTFLIADIENFGFESDIQDVWIEKDDTIKGIALRYHTMLIVYSKGSMDFSKINHILDEYNIEFISGKSTVIDGLSPYLKDDYIRKDNKLMEYMGENAVTSIRDDIIIGKEEDAMDIARSYGDIKEFENLYSSDVNIRYNQIHSRIVSGEGIHVFIKDEKGILSHGNTTAENTYTAIIGGLFTREEKRNKGYGTGILKYLVDYLKGKGKEIALFYEDENLYSFFKQKGFENIGTWSMLRRK